MSALTQPSLEAETAALARDFQNREFITDFSLSVQQLASFVSRFESVAKAKIAALDGKLARLERLLDTLESVKPAHTAEKENLSSNLQRIDDNPDWQDGAFIGLAACYGLIALVAVVQLIRIQRRVPEYGWTTQKVFHLLNAFVCISRCVTFALREKVQQMHPATVSAVLLDLPGLLFFSTYTLLVLFWAEIYHQARSLPGTTLRPIFVAFNVFVYAVQIGLWIYSSMVHGKQLALERVMSCIFLAVVSLSAAAGFLLYGGRLFTLLRRFPIESRGRKKKLREVGFVTCICAACFTARAVIVAWSAFDKADADLDVMVHPLLNIVYYTIVELVPSALVLYILRKLPPKRAPQGYQQIPPPQSA